MCNFDESNLAQLKPDTTSQLKQGILKQLLYSEVFKHPLTIEELIRFSPVGTSLELSEIRSIVEELKADCLLKTNEGYISVVEHENKIENRISGSEKAEALLGKAVKVASFIQKFPFVEGVGISGSLSKGILHSDGDFDFFIITKANRVWVARTLLILYKKIFLLNSRKYFCVNYFIDSDHLEIEEKNRFTAVEVATLIPVAGKVFDEFYNNNQWVETYFPQGARTKFDTKEIKKPVLSRVIQSILGKKFGDSADSRAMKITLKRWKKKFGDFNENKFDLTMKTRRYVSKHHPNDFQSKVLGRYEDLKNEFKSKHMDVLKKHNIEL